MAINENQLDTWANPGSLVQSANTYQSIKGVIEDKRAPYAGRSITSFLQGSYGNDTNIIGAESDVDIVLKSSAVYYYDISRLPPATQEGYKASHPAAQYKFADFKAEVGTWLQQQYGKDLDSGAKALHIKANGGRRNADVLPCMNFRRYRAYRDDNNALYDEGICFMLPDGTRVENFPVQHRDNCIQKNQDTGLYFKPMVRIIKNMRNRMRDQGMIADKIAPSYYIEGLISNVPNELFGHSYERTFLQCYRYLRGANAGGLMCANRLVPLLGAGATSWDLENFAAFFQALGDFWDNF